MKRIFSIECDLCGNCKEIDTTDWREEYLDDLLPRGWTEHGSGYFWSFGLNICPRCTKELKRRCKPIYKEFIREIKDRKKEAKV